MINDLEKVNEAIAIGDKAGARRLLAPILQNTPTAETWLLAARVMESEEKIAICIKKALELEPTNEGALRISARMLNIVDQTKVNQMIAHNTQERLLQYLDIAPKTPEPVNVGPDSEGVFEMLWDCQNCGTKKNLGKTHRFCPNCGTPQNPRWRYFPSDADKVRVDDHVFEGGDQVCSSCGHLNGGAAEFCGRCGAPTDGSERAAKIDSRQKAEGLGFAGQDLQSRLHQEYDAAVGRITPEAQAATQKRKRRGWITYAVIGIVLLLVAGAVFLFTRTEDKTVQVSDHRWERTINIEVLRAESGSSSCGSEPVDAYGIDRRYEQVDTRRVPDGETCSNRQVDQGDGTFRQERVCETRYRNEPVMGYVCYYTVNRWRNGRSVEATGDRSDPIVWPDLNLRSGSCVGCEREGTRDEAYILILDEVGGDDRYECDVNKNLWERTSPGNTFTLRVASLTNRPNCDSLTP